MTDIRLVTSSRPSLLVLLGLPTLYASGYYIPSLQPMGAYLLPADALFRLIVLPSLIAVAVGSALVFAAWMAARKFSNTTMLSLTAVLCLSLLMLIGLKGILETAGLHWQDRIPRGHDLEATQQYVRAAAFLAMVAVAWLIRESLSKLVRALSSLGLALAVVAIIRLVTVWNPHPPAARSDALSYSIRSVEAHSVMASHVSSIPGAKPRRVVWVIFDETDFARLYSSGNLAPPEFSNFNRLAQVSVFATHANSPASATLYSIPALISGVPEDGVQMSSGARLSMRQAGQSVPFEQSTSIFGALAELGDNASVLGFFQPYCRLFPVQRCDDFAWPEVGRLDDALLANVPSSIVKRLLPTEDWAAVTAGLLGLLPQYLARTDALTFIHLNIPHLPASHADSMLGLPPSADPLVEYSRNLMLADHTLGVVLRGVEQEAAVRDILLVVSTDHWLRNRWYQADVPEISRPVLFAVWKVGELRGQVLAEPVSTVHTAAMILDYLSGAISSQDDIAHWWSRQPVYPTYVAPNS